MEENNKPLETIRTLKGDIEGMVRDNEVSVVSVVSQEADRKSGAESRAEEVAAKNKRARLVLFGALLLMCGVGVSIGTYLLFAQPVSTGREAAALPKQIAITTQVKAVPAQTVVPTIQEHPAGPVAYVPTHDGEEQLALTAREAFFLLFPNGSDRLAYSLGPKYTFLATPQGPALLFEVNAYERGYSEMLAWERTSLEATLANVLGTPGTTTPYTDAILFNLDNRTNGDTLYTFQTDKLLIMTTEPVLKSIIPLLGGV